jgi:hypothetical protein
LWGGSRRVVKIKNNSFFCFQEKQKPISEAHKFFNYYQANGWMVGKNKMKNWRAAANNWILNANKFQKQDLEKINAYLNVDQDKNYAIPL